MTDFAGRYDEGLFRTHGNGGTIYAMTDATVTVYESDGTTEATLYTDRDKTAGTNPVSPDSGGNLEFFADPGTYVIEIKVGSTTLRTDTVVVPVDPADAILEIADDDVAIWTT